MESNLETSDRVFLLGLGAQKCGTTWLHRYLAQDPSFNGGIAKEYHVWDALDIPVMRHKLGNFMDIRRGGKFAERYRMQKKTDRYFDYFDGLLHDDVSLTADISPSYSGLGVSRMEFIRDEFAQRNIKARSIILIRDPLSRIKSAVKYNLRKRNYNEGIRKGETQFLPALKQYYQSEECKIRTTYQDTIRNAYAVFGKADTYVGIYESMFEPNEIRRLSLFCKVTSRPELTEVYYKRKSGNTEENQELNERIRDAYKATYDFCFEVFPRTKTLWATGKA